MSFDLGSSKGKNKRPEPDMNVTPLIDVVLVLLIIFMAMTPLVAQRFWVHTPKQEKKELAQPEVDPNPPLVLKVEADRRLVVNGTAVELTELVERLRRMFAAREDHVIFFDAADDTPFGYAVEVMDKAREGGAVTIATLTKPVGS